MTMTLPVVPTSPLRQRLIEDMNMRRFAMATQRNYIRDVSRFATFLGRPPDTASAEDVRRFQIEQRDAGVPAPTMNSIVAALRFFFAHTLDRPDLARKLYRVPYPRRLPIVLSPDEVARLLQATTCLKHQAALSVAYGAGLRVAEVAMLKVRDVDSDACCSGSSAVRAGSTATPCSRPTCSHCCAAGGKSGTSKGSAMQPDDRSRGAPLYRSRIARDRRR